jgi:hypothetical protein
MIRNGFRVSPADHARPLMGDPRTFGKWVGGAQPGPRPSWRGKDGAAAADGKSIHRGLRTSWRERR